MLILTLKQQNAQSKWENLAWATATPPCGTAAMLWTAGACKTSSGNPNQVFFQIFSCQSRSRTWNEAFESISCFGCEGFFLPTFFLATLDNLQECQVVTFRVSNTSMVCSPDLKVYVPKIPSFRFVDQRCPRRFLIFSPEAGTLRYWMPLTYEHMAKWVQTPRRYPGEYTVFTPFNNTAKPKDGAGTDRWVACHLQAKRQACPLLWTGFEPCQKVSFKIQCGSWKWYWNDMAMLINLPNRGVLGILCLTHSLCGMHILLLLFEFLPERVSNFPSSHLQVKHFCCGSPIVEAVSCSPTPGIVEIVLIFKP